MSVVKKVFGFLVLVPIIILSILKGITYLVLAFVFKGRGWMFQKKTRDTRPSCMEEAELGTHKTVTVKGLNFHVVVSGDPQKPLMLFMHGFPECWYSWRHQIREFNKDYYCVAFDMRGVGETDAPLGVKHYSQDELVDDVRELIRALGYTTCTLVGHDWGGAVAWQFVARYPDLVDRLIEMNIPHPKRMQEVIASGLKQIRMSWYAIFFQVPYLSELLVTIGDYAFIKGACKKGPSTAEDIEAFKYSFSRPGRATAFLNYYRAAIRYPPRHELEKIKCPTLLIWGTGDVALHTDNSYGTEKFCDNLKVVRIEGGDHFIQQEQPDVVNRIMREYLAEN